MFICCSPVTVTTQYFLPFAIIQNHFSRTKSILFLRYMWSRKMKTKSYFICREVQKSQLQCQWQQLINAAAYVPDWPLVASYWGARWAYGKTYMFGWWESLERLNFSFCYLFCLHLWCFYSALPSDMLSVKPCGRLSDSYFLGLYSVDKVSSEFLIPP